MTHLLQIRELTVTRGQGHTAYRVTLPALDLQRGEVAAITGPSGCGKSTLLEVLGLILAPRQVERFTLGDDPPLDLATLLHQNRQAELADVRARRLGFVLQTGGLLPFLTVRQNLQLPRRLGGLPPDSDTVDLALARLDLIPQLDKLPRQLSIGQRQRAAFVRAIAHQPDLLLADEPTAALDPLQAQTLFELIIEIARQLQIAALLVSHDWDRVRACGLRTFTGTPTADGSGTEFRDD